MRNLCFYKLLLDLTATFPKSLQDHVYWDLVVTCTYFYSNVHKSKYYKTNLVGLRKRNVEFIDLVCLTI